MRMIGDMKKFSFAELTSNDNGKTSGSGFVGVLVGTVGALAFLLGVIDKMFISHTMDIISQASMYTGIGATLLGVRKVVTSKGSVVGANATDDTVPTPETDTPVPTNIVAPDIVGATSTDTIGATADDTSNPQQ